MEKISTANAEESVERKETSPVNYNLNCRGRLETSSVKHFFFFLLGAVSVEDVAAGVELRTLSDEE